MYVNYLAGVCSISVMLAFGKDLKQLNNFVENLISFKSSKRQLALLCLIHDRTAWSVCCSSFKPSRVHSQFLPPCSRQWKQTEWLESTRGLTLVTRPRKNQQRNKSTLFKTTSVGWRQKRGSHPHIPHWPWLQNLPMLTTLIIPGSSDSSVLT